MQATNKLLRQIVVRNADKFNIFVLFDRNYYKRKLNSILNDSAKFLKVHRNPTEKLKKQLNNIVQANNAIIDQDKHSEVVGDFQPDYLYGNCNIFKSQDNPPLRLIFSQIPSPTYQISTVIYKLIKPNLTGNYSLKSTDEFLNLV